MATQDRNTLKNWFRKGMKPLAVQFSDWIDSFWHKGDSLPISSVEGLSGELNNKAALESVSDLTHRVETLEGVSGSSIKLAEIDSEGNLFVTTEADGKINVGRVRGTNGETPRVGEDGNWWIGTLNTGYRSFSRA